MKRKVVKTILSVSVAASMAVASPAAIWAAQETETAASEEAVEEGQEETKDILLTLEEGELTITNQTERSFSGAELQESQDAAQESEDAAQETPASEEAQDSSDEEEMTEESVFINLVLTEENGDIHTFEDVEADTWTEPLVYDEYGFLYISYKDQDGNTKEVEESADEKEFEGALTMYASSNVHIREKADQDSESLKILQLGDEATAVGAVPGWIKVESGDVSGYVFHSYITENKEKVDALVQEKEAAEAAAAQAAAEAAAAQAAAQQAAAQQAAAQAWAQQQQQQTQEVYEVSRQKFDDCDGSGHGYYEITYSDGSVAYEEY